MKYTLLALGLLTSVTCFAAQLDDTSKKQLKAAACQAFCASQTPAQDVDTCDISSTEATYNYNGATTETGSTVKGTSSSVTYNIVCKLRKE